MNEEKLDLASICKELGLNLDGDVFVAINNVNLKTTYVYIDAIQGIAKVIPKEHINREIEESLNNEPKIK